MTKSRILAAMGQKSEAETAKEKALSLGNAQQLYGYGRQLQRDGNQQEAFAVFKQAAQKDPNNWLAHAGLARIACAEGNYPQATKEMQLALAAAPDNAKSGVEGLVDRQGDGRRLLNGTRTARDNHLVGTSGGLVR